MIVGVDLDNTIVRYDALFRRAAARAGLVGEEFTGTKRALRDAVRALPNGEERWTQLQATVYGPAMHEAVAFEGFEAFAARCAELGIPLYVVSHKSTHAAAAPGGPNLRDAAARWLAGRFADDVFAGVFFEDDRAAKVRRIRALGCTHFIDDLLEVFGDPGFPERTVPWLFDPGEGPATGDWGLERFSSWYDLAARLDEEREAWRIAEMLAGGPVDGLQLVAGGANNRLYRVAFGERTLALKRYGIPDERGRLVREEGALRLIDARAGVAPALLACHAPSGSVLTEWISGVPAGQVPQPGDVARMLEAIALFDRLRERPAASALPEAAEAGLSLGRVWRQIEQRVERLRACAPELRDFLDDFGELFAQQRARASGMLDPAAELARELRTLSPSDFGLHNAVRRPDGTLGFVDFEYFGWDDPVKLTADVVLHPGMRLCAADIKEWLEGAKRIFGRDGGFAARLAAAGPTYALKWSLIVLNEFRPEVLQRRRAARPHADWQAAKAAQLHKARALLDRIRHDRVFDNA